jgi:hypothetical protein
MNFFKSENFNPKRAKILYHPDGLSRGLGFVQLGSSCEANQVIDSLNCCMFEGRELNINLA